MKLNDVLSELSSTYAIIHLLQIEINSKHSRISDGDNSRDKSTHDSKNQHNVKDIQENWKLVMSKHQLKLWKPTYSETLQNIKLITVTNSYAYLSNLEDRGECETIGRNLDASSNLCTYSSQRNENKGTDETMKYDVHTPPYLKQTSRLQRKKNSSSLNMPVTEKPSKIILTIINGKLFHYNNNKTIKGKPSNYNMKSNMVVAITSKTNDMNGQTSEHKITMIGDSSKMCQKC